jgi:hypothetical protein
MTVNQCNKSLKNVSSFKYLGATIINQICIHKEIKNRLSSGNTCYHAVLLSSYLLSKYVKTKLYKTIILPIVLYGCETFSLTLRKEYILKVFEYRVLKRIFGPVRDEVTGRKKKLHNELHNL